MTLPKNDARRLPKPARSETPSLALLFIHLRESKKARRYVKARRDIILKVGLVLTAGLKLTVRGKFVIEFTADGQDIMTIRGKSLFPCHRGNLWKQTAKASFMLS